MRTRRWLVGLLVLASVGLAAPTVEIVADHQDGCYDLGQTARFTIAVADGQVVPTGGTVRWQFSNDGVGDLGRGEAAWAGQPLEVPGQLATPGVLRLLAFWDAGLGAKPVMGLGGAAFAYDRILPAAAEPDDFVSWWTAQKALLAQVPINPELTRDDKASTDTIDVYQMQLATSTAASCGAGSAAPKKAGKYPAILMVPGAALAATRPSPATRRRGT